jgi:uncharacterized membrane protein YdjX (TVP38/TMEM64 family)
MTHHALSNFLQTVLGSFVGSWIGMWSWRYLGEPWFIRREKRRLIKLFDKRVGEMDEAHEKAILEAMQRRRNTSQ